MQLQNYLNYPYLSSPACYVLHRPVSVPPYAAGASSSLGRRRTELAIVLLL